MAIFYFDLLRGLVKLKKKNNNKKGAKGEK